jgi:FemAB-related protein (PEP-CTERM system-associated)
MTVSIPSAFIGEAQWDGYVRRAAGSTLYHLSGWRQVIEQTFGHRTHYLSAVDRSAAVVGVLPLVQLQSRMFGNMLVSLPFFNYGGICADIDSARDSLFEAAIELASTFSADFIEIRQEDEGQQWQRDLPKKTAKVSMRLSLPGSADEMWRSLGAKLRNQVQRPRKEGMTTVIGGEELLDGFYDVFSSNMRDLGTPVYAKRFFRNALRQFPGQTWISSVYSGTTPVASGFIAGFRDRMEIPWASSLRGFNKFSPNMLLYWSCLEFACESGYRVFDFGRSTPHEGTYKFKEQWGAKPYPLYWYYWLPEGRPMPQVNTKNPKYRAAIALWQHLPLGLTRLIGPGIVKYIP